MSDSSEVENSGRAGADTRVRSASQKVRDGFDRIEAPLPASPQKVFWGEETANKEPMLDLAGRDQVYSR